MDFKYLVLSDIHLGHNLNKTETIVMHLNKFFDKYDNLIRNVDAIFLAGDVYHRLLTMSSTDAILSTEWLTQLAIFCRTHNIKLRILEGTPAHDVKQCLLFKTTLKNLKIDIDFKYIGNLYIEHFVEKDIHVLYVPDEYKHKSEDTVKAIKEYYKQIEIAQVDTCIMHGAFRYQIPAESPSNFSETEMLNLVRYYIHAGHIHTSSIYRRIINQGSFDRLAHGEEESKGGLICSIGKESSYKRLINTDATMFLTLPVNADDTLESFTERNGQLIESLYEKDAPSHLRILVSKHHPMNHSLDELKRIYPYFKWTKKNTEDEEQQVVKSMFKKEEFLVLDINSGNVTDLIRDDTQKLNLDKSVSELVMKELSYVV